MNLVDTLQFYSINYDNNSNNLYALFNGYVVDSRIDKELLNGIIVKELGAMKPFTTNVIVFKNGVEIFFKKYKDNISNLLDTLEYEYNPIENKNITEQEHRESEGNIDNTDKYTTNTDNKETGSKTDEKQISAFDATTYQNKEKNTSTPNLTTENDVEHEGETKSDIKSEVDTNKTITGKDGDTSIQSLITEERKLAEFNIYNWIIKTMRKELFLLVY